MGLLQPHATVPSLNAVNKRHVAQADAARARRSTVSLHPSCPDWLSMVLPLPAAGSLTSPKRVGLMSRLNGGLSL